MLTEKVMELKDHGKSDAEIAKELGLSEADVAALVRGYLEQHQEDVALGRKVFELVREERTRRVADFIRKEQGLNTDEELGRYFNKLSKEEIDSLIRRACTVLNIRVRPL